MRVGVSWLREYVDLPGVTGEELDRALVSLGIEVESVVDAANTYAAFLRGPDGVRIEYVEHKPTFSLT